MASLAPFEPALGPQPAASGMYSSQQTVLAMKEKVFSLSGDDFTIKTAEGQDVLMCKGKVMSMRGRKTFAKLNGDELFQITKKMLALNTSFRGESPHGYDFEVKGHFKLMGSKSTVSFKNAADGSELELELKGDWIDKSATISYGGRPVAQISREYFNARELFGGQQTYFVAVAPNVDLSLIAGLCVCLDERENEN